MGKRKIGEIYNKPIVEGDINLKTPNEIHKSELGGGASTAEVKEYYYLFNSNKYIEEYESKYGTIDKTNVDEVLGFAYALFEYRYIRDQSDARDDYLEKNLSISNYYNPIYTFSKIKGFILRTPVFISYPYLATGNAKEIAYKLIDFMLPDKDSPDAIVVTEMSNMFLNNLTEVSKEEFYSNFKLQPIII